MSRVDSLVKILIDEGYSPSQLFDNFDEVLGKHEDITYRSGTKNHEFRYIHRGYIKNEPIFAGTYIIKNAENPRFLPNDIEFYLGFIRLIRNSGLPLETLKRNLPFYAYSYTLDYFKADSDRCPKIDEAFDTYFSNSTDFKDKKLTDGEKKHIGRDYIYALNMPKGADLNSGKPYVYTVDQRKFKNLFGYAMCVEINSVLNNLLALVGYDTLTIAGTVSHDDKSTGHCYNLMREYTESPYSIIDCAMRVTKTEPLINDPYKGYDVEVRNIDDMTLNYPMPSFEGSTSDTPNIYAFSKSMRRFDFKGL